MRPFKKLLLLSTIALPTLVTLPAFAEDAPKASAKPAAESGAELVVTGTRIRRKDLNTASPVVTITAQDAELEGAGSAADMLQTIPQAASTQQTNRLLGGYVVTGGAGVETLSLYGLGAQRTLILLNGRRMGPAGVGGTVGPVDLNVLPLDALKQVDILLDGSSSIYGSDAVGGVVNFITKKNTDGVDLILHADSPFLQYGKSYTGTITAGKTFDKGYISLLASYHEDTGLTLGDRKNTKCAADYYFGTSVGDRVDLLGVDGKPKCFNSLYGSFQGFGFGGVFQYDPTLSNYPSYPAAALNLRGVLPQWVRAGRAGQPATYPYETTDGPIISRQSVISPVKTTTFLVTGGYDISSTMNLYTELMYNQRLNTTHGDYQLFPWVEPDNPTNTVAAGLATAFPGGGGYARPIILYNHDYRTDVKYSRAVVGLKGTITGLGFLDGYTYDTSYQISSSDAQYGQAFVYNDRVNAATTFGGLACDPSMITISGGSCVTIPWFTPDVLNGKFTKAQSDFLFGYEVGKTKYIQQSLEYNLSGDIFTLPAGKVSAVAGLFLQNHQMNDTPGFNARNSNYWGFSTSGITKGQYSSEEIYGEVYAPLIKDVFLVKNLDLTVSGRASNYSNYGENGTFKVGMVWNLTNEYAFHATFGDSYRAPTIYEAKLANQTGFLDLTDPCIRWGDSTSAKIQTRCAAEGIPNDYAGALASSLIYTGGGSDLLPETSVNTMFGATWSPAFADLKVTADFNNLRIKNAIQNFGAQNIINACYFGATYPSFFCSLFTRDTNHDIAVVNDDYINVGRISNRNISLKVDYRLNLPKGRLSVFSQSSWQLSNKTKLGDQTSDYTGSVGNPIYTNQTNINFKSGDWTYHWGFDLTGVASDLRYYTNGSLIAPSATFPAGYIIKAKTEFYDIHNIAVSRQFDKFRLTIGLDNAFNVTAPNLSSGEFRVGTAALNMYDLRGRSVYVTVDKHF